MDVFARGCVCMVGGNLVNDAGKVIILGGANAKYLNPAHLSPLPVRQIDQKHCHRFKGLGRRRVCTICGAGAAIEGAGGARILLFFDLDPKSALRSVNERVSKFLIWDCSKTH